MHLWIKNKLFMKKLTVFFLSTLFLFSCSNEQNKKEVKVKYASQNAKSKSKENDTVKIGEIKKVQEVKNLDLPFIGKRFFNFLRGTGTGYSIEIKSNGDCIILGLPGPEPMNRDLKPVTVYHAKYSDLKDYKIIGNKIYCLEKDGTISKDCLGPNTPCVSDLSPMY
jgi:hypothetical protein